MIRKTATLALATLAAAATLAACGPANDEAAPSETSKAAEATENTSDGGTTEEGIMKFPLEGATGVGESGAEYTLGAPEPLSSEYADLLTGVGWDQDKIDAVRVIPVVVDNTYGADDASVGNLTAVDSDGASEDYTSITGFLYEVSEADNLAERDYDTYQKVWDAYEATPGEVPPTAKGEDYIVIEDGADSADKEFTYLGVTSGAPLEEPTLLYPPDFDPYE